MQITENPVFTKFITLLVALRSDLRELRARRTGVVDEFLESEISMVEKGILNLEREFNPF